MNRHIGHLLGLLLVLGAVPAPATSDAPGPPEELVTVCKIEFTEIARKARFDLLYAYRLTTGESGAVEGIEDLPGTRSATFVRDERFVPCLRSWRLEANQVYEVAIRVSWDVQRNFIAYSRPNGTKVTLALGEWGWQKAPSEER